MIGLLLKGMLSIIPLAPEILVAYSIFAICFDKVRNLELEIYSSKSFFFSAANGLGDLIGIWTDL